jgi:hypothetical protein
METFDVDYHHTAVEFEQMRSLLVNTCLESKKPFNWRLAMAENWNYASRFLEPVEYFRTIGKFLDPRQLSGLPPGSLCLSSFGRGDAGLG